MIEKSEADHQREMYFLISGLPRKPQDMPSFLFMIQEDICAIRRIQRGRKRPASILGAVKKGFRTDNIVYYRTDPDLSITDRDISCFRGQDRCIQKAVQKPAILFLILQGKTWMIFRSRGVIWGCAAAFRCP